MATEAAKVQDARAAARSRARSGDEFYARRRLSIGIVHCNNSFFRRLRRSRQLCSLYPSPVIIDRRSKFAFRRPCCLVDDQFPQWIVFQLEYASYWWRWILSGSASNRSSPISNNSTQTSISVLLSSNRLTPSVIWASSSIASYQCICT